MKKLQHIFTPVILVGLLCGCGGDDEEAVELAMEDVVMEVPASPPDAPAAAPDPNAPPPVPDVPPVPGTGAPKEEEAAAPSTISSEKVEAVVTTNVAKEGDTVMLQVIQMAVESYFEDKGALPSSIDDLLKSKHLQALPKLPAGKTVRIDGTTLEVTLEEAAE